MAALPFRSWDRKVGDSACHMLVGGTAFSEAHLTLRLFLSSGLCSLSTVPASFLRPLEEGRRWVFLPPAALSLHPLLVPAQTSGSPSTGVTGPHTEAPLFTCTSPALALLPNQPQEPLLECERSWHEGPRLGDRQMNGQPGHRQLCRAKESRQCACKMFAPM